MFHRTREIVSAPIGHQKADQLHHFADGDETIIVRTTLHPNGTYTAIDCNDPGITIGFGFSTIGAIADLFEKLPRAKSEREERDRQADAFDHARNERKNYEAAP